MCAAKNSCRPSDGARGARAAVMNFSLFASMHPRNDAPCCSTHRLVVEVDGGIPLAQRERDAARQRAIERLGYRFLRVSADLVERDVAAAVALVRAALG